MIKSRLSDRSVKTTGSDFRDFFTAHGVWVPEVPTNLDAGESSIRSRELVPDMDPTLRLLCKLRVHVCVSL